MNFDFDSLFFNMKYLILLCSVTVWDLGKEHVHLNRKIQLDAESNILSIMMDDEMSILLRWSKKKSDLSPTYVREDNSIHL